MVISKKPLIVKNLFFKDNRGDFLKLVHKEYFLNLNKKKIIKQVNISNTKTKGTIRGFHYQKKPYQEKKIITCIKGSIFDVVINMNKNSKYFGRIYKFILDVHKKTLIIPEGYAHGFQTLKNDCTILYMHTNYYKVDHEVTIYPLLKKISWPVKKKILSKKDLKGLKL